MFALVDCNNFYASCERVFQPRLEGRAILVLSNNDGCVIARSHEAKALGIPMGLPFFKLDPQLRRQVVVFSSNYALYGDLSRRVMQVSGGLCAPDRGRFDRRVFPRPVRRGGSHRPGTGDGAHRAPVDRDSGLGRNRPDQDAGQARQPSGQAGTDSRWPGARLVAAARPRGDARRRSRSRTCGASRSAGGSGCARSVSPMPWPCARPSRAGCVSRAAWSWSGSAGSCAGAPVCRWRSSRRLANRSGSRAPSARR